MSDIRTGFVGIVIENRDSAPQVNRILSMYAHMIRGRIGIPNPQDQTAVIGLIIEGDNDSIGAMTGKLGSLKGIVAKSAMTKKKENVV